MIQGALFDLPPASEPVPLCENGNPSPWMPGYDGPDHCPACHAEVNAAVARFMEAVKAGIYDDEGYTPNERCAQAKRLQAPRADATGTSAGG